MPPRRYRTVKLPPEELTPVPLKGPKLPVLKEDEEQELFFDWLEVASGRQPLYKLAFAVPNFSGTGKKGTLMRRVNQRHGAKLKRTGRKPGVPDIVFPVARGGYHSLYIEMKRLRGSTMTDEQKVWIPALREQGHLVEVCKGWEEARDCIERYVALDTVPSGK